MRPQPCWICELESLNCASQAEAFLHGFSYGTAAAKHPFPVMDPLMTCDKHDAEKDAAVDKCTRECMRKQAS